MTTLAQAIAFAQAHEVPWPRDPLADPSQWGVHHADPPPYNRLLGPVRPRQAPGAAPVHLRNAR